MQVNFFDTKNASCQIQIGVKIAWDNADLMNGSWDMYLASLADFAGIDEIIIIINFAKESSKTW